MIMSNSICWADSGDAAQYVNMTFSQWVFEEMQGRKKWH